jgi:peptide/nickel transport system substrate-binding protein
VISNAPSRVRIAATAAVLMLAAACGSSSTAQSGGPGFDLASKQILDPSTKAGGTITMTFQNALDSLDPGDTYRAQTWNLYRTFGRGLLSWVHEPGTAGQKLEGDLAEGPGTVSDNGLTWTYKIRSGATYEDGGKITSKDVKWAVERSGWDPDNHSSGPTYFNNILTPDEGATKRYAAGRWNVYKQGDLPDSIISTPDDQTIVFHLPHQFGEFDYLMMMPDTYPVPYHKDLKDPVGYANKPVSSGAYRIASYSAGKELVLVKNDAYNPASDPNHLHVATHAQALTDPAIKSQVDDYSDGSLTYAGLNVNVLKDINCRQAVEWGVDKAAVLNEFGGSWGGSIATSMLPDSIPGHVSFDLYGLNPAAAKQALAKCPTAVKQPDGSYRLSTNIAVQANNPDLDNAATAMQASLKAVGIDTQIELFASNKYYSSFAGETNYANNNNLGIILSTWIADWPSGYGFLDQITTADGIAQPGVGGSSNVSQYHSAAVDALFKDALSTTDKAQQQKDWGEVDQQAMKDAMAVPLVQRKVLSFRSSQLTNVMFNGGVSGYDLSVLGLK